MRIEAVGIRRLLNLCKQRVVSEMCVEKLFSNQGRSDMTSNPLPIASCFSAKIAGFASASSFVS
jgi:hypothetical protein